MNYTYAAILFQGQNDPNATASQLAALLNEKAASGWEFVSVESIDTFIPAGCGCLGALLGMQSRIVTHNYAIFRRPQ